MSTIPEIKVENGVLVGWREFENWAARTEPLWCYALSYSGRGGCGHQDALKLIAYHLTLRTRELEEQLIDLGMIAPKKVRGSNGETWIYRCPDHLVP
jgi:hypothetical protein